MQQNKLLRCQSKSGKCYIGFDFSDNQGSIIYYFLELLTLSIIITMVSNISTFLLLIIIKKGDSINKIQNKSTKVNK
jgi:hypothetical protein